MTAEPAALIMVVEVMAHRVKCAGQILVIAVEESNDVTCRSCYALINRVGLAAIRLADPISQPILILLNNFDAVIGGPAVNDYVFKIPIALVKDGENSLLQEPPLII